MSTTKYIDHLTEDEPIKNQLWVCMSFLSPEGIKNCSLRALKIRGVYATRPEADARAKELQDIDPYFHVFVGEVGKWLPWDPDPNSVQDQEYQNKELNDLMKGYKDNLEKAKKMQQERKQDMIRKAAQEEQEPTKVNGRSNKTKQRLQKKLEAMKQQKKMDELVGQQLAQEEKGNNQKGPVKKSEKEKELAEYEAVIKEEEQAAKAERERLTALNKNITEKKQNLETIDSKLEKIKELYEKLNSGK